MRLFLQLGIHPNCQFIMLIQKSGRLIVKSQTRSRKSAEVGSYSLHDACRTEFNPSISPYLSHVISYKVHLSFSAALAVCYVGVLMISLLVVT